MLFSEALRDERIPRGTSRLRSRGVNKDVGPRPDFLLKLLHVTYVRTSNQRFSMPERERSVQQWPSVNVGLI